MQLTIVKEDVRNIIASVIGMDPGEIKDGDEIGKDLEADSISIIEIALKLEDKFKVIIPDKEYPDLTSVDKIAARVDILKTNGEARFGTHG